MVNKKIKIKDKKINYTLRRRRGTRSVRLAIYPDGAFVVTAPQWYPVCIINRFIAEKAEWIYGKLKNVDPEALAHKMQTESSNYKMQKRLAGEIIQQRIEFFNRNYNFYYGRVSVKNQRSCWGSCSWKKNLNFSYKIANLPERLRDYVIVHELCHLKELNHGSRFWKLVERVIPGYKNLRKELKELRFYNF